MSGIIPVPLTGLEDYLALDYGVGFTNIVERTTPGSKDLSRYLDFSFFCCVGACINMSGFVDKKMTSDDDMELLDYGIGFSTIVPRTTPGSKDLSKYMYIYFVLSPCKGSRF